MSKSEPPSDVKPLFISVGPQVFRIFFYSHINSFSATICPAATDGLFTLLNKDTAHKLFVLYGEYAPALLICFIFIVIMGRAERLMTDFESYLPQV